MLDHYHAESLGTRYKDQSTTEIETSSHGSEVCNCRVQRVFFLSRQLLSAGSRNYCGFAAHNCSFATEKKTLWRPGYLDNRVVNEHFTHRKILVHTCTNTSLRRLKTQMTFAFRLVRKQRIHDTRYHFVATRLTVFLILLLTWQGICEMLKNILTTGVPSTLFWRNLKTQLYFYG